MKYPKLFIGPMSLNIVDSVIEYCNEHDVCIGLIPSRRQIDYDNGYVNNWNTDKFCNYVRSKTNNVLLVRDHGGPNQGTNYDDGLISLKYDVKVNNIEVIHIDVWKSFQNLNDGIKNTINYINYCYNLNNNIYFEVGTEQSIREFNEKEIFILLSELKTNLKSEIFDKIKYVVIQSGTALLSDKNIGKYNSERLISMIKVAKDFNLITKEHNGDYLPISLIKQKFEIGLDSINLAPEFGQIETNLILNKIQTQNKVDMLETFYRICYESRRWEKWLPQGFEPSQNKVETIKVSGHYVFSSPEFIEIKNALNISDEEIKIEIKKKISAFYE